MKSRPVVLRDEHSPEGSRHLAASVTEAGDLNIEGHDLGPGVEKAFGEGLTEYEWTIIVRKDHVPKLVAALGGNKRDNVLTLLAARFSEDEECASTTFLEGEDIPVEFWNRVGD